jgi:hypothetical protein
MFVSRSRALRGSSLAPPLSALALLGVLSLLASLLVGASSLAGPAPSVVALSAPDAERAGLALRFVAHAELPTPVTELVASVGAPSATLLAVAANGDSAALAEPRGQDPSTLVLAVRDGHQLRVAMPGLLAAAFSPDGSWLAATDGNGRLWKVGAQDGSTELLADGPYAGPLSVDGAGAVLALAVPSVEAPWSAHAVRLAIGAPAEALSAEDLVYSIQSLADGSLAMVAHRPGRTVVQHVVDAALVAELDLGSAAINVSVSADFGAVAFEREGGIFLRNANGQVREIARGANPRLSPDGRLLLADAAGETRAYGMDGTILARLSGVAAFESCGSCES